MEILNIIMPYMYGGGEREKNLSNCIECIKGQTKLIHITEEPYKINFIVIEQYKDTEKFRYKDFCNKYISVQKNFNFNKSWCINIGIKEAISDKSLANNILVLDSDILFDRTFFAKILYFKRKHKFFSCYDCITSLQGKDNPMLRQLQFNGDMSAMGGAWYTEKDFFLTKLGGMNENYYGYGGEDNDLYLRATEILRTIPAMGYHIIHQYHDWAKSKNKDSDSHWYINENRMKILEATEKEPSEISQRIKKINIGNINNPKEIYINDILDNKTIKQSKLNILWLYQYANHYNFDHWLHMDYARHLAKTKRISLYSYGLELEKGYPRTTLIPYNENLTLEQLRKIFKFDVIILNTKSRMFKNYFPANHPENKEKVSVEEGCWLPTDFKTFDVPKIVIEEDYHYEPNDDWYKENNIDLILHRHYSQSLRPHQVKAIWFPFSVDTEIFNLKKHPLDRIKKICFCGSFSDVYVHRQNAIKILREYPDMFLHVHYIENEYIKCLNRYIGFLSGSSIYNHTPAKIFEIIASGGILLTNDNVELYGLNKLFSSDCYSTYKTDYSDIIEKAKMITSNNEYVDYTINKGMSEIYNKHTHEIRTNELKEILNKEFNL